MIDNTSWFVSLQIFLLFTFAALLPGGAIAQQRAIVTPLPRAHSHNDYEQETPLRDALLHGFCSVEADIFKVHDTLLVGHNRWTLNKNRTLKSLYLEPLKNRVRETNGSVYNDTSMFTLLVDIKQNGDQVYPLLKTLLNQYEFMLSGIRDGTYEERAVQVVISGSCPRKLISGDPSRLVSIDGRLSDLDSEVPSHLIPMISSSWGSSFKWRGRNKIPDEQLALLKSIVSRAHAKKRRVRFWAAPESEAVWQQLYINDVDHINTDNLAQLKGFLLKQKPER